MAGDQNQQFCLRWNNHQSTIISNFDTLLESGALVDCTLAAEGRHLRAHKVVLSACSPYFEALLSEHYDKHPVFILKDVKHSELRAMMDYMYRGEVNVSQGELPALLLAAKSLQIKGLSDSGQGAANVETEQGGGAGAASANQVTSRPTRSASSSAGNIPQASSSSQSVEKTKVPRQSLQQMNVNDLPEDSVSPRLKGFTSREGSQSPTGRKRKRVRRRSQGTDDTASMGNHDASNSSDVAAPALGVAPVAEKTHAESTTTAGRSALMQQLTKPADELHQMSLEKPEPNDEMIQPKSEYLDDQESVEELTNLDDDMNDLTEMDQDGSRPGPSSHNASHGGIASWHVAGDQSNTSGIGAGGPQGGQDEVFLAAHEAAQAQRDSQVSDDDNEDGDDEEEEEGEAYKESLRRSLPVLTPISMVHLPASSFIHPPKINRKKIVASKRSMRFKTLPSKYNNYFMPNMKMENHKQAFLKKKHHPKVKSSAAASYNYEDSAPPVLASFALSPSSNNKHSSGISKKKPTSSSSVSAGGARKPYHPFRKYKCPNANCDRAYSHRRDQQSHTTHECGKEPIYKCARCGYLAHFVKQIRRHSESRHKYEAILCINLVKDPVGVFEITASKNSLPRLTSIKTSANSTTTSNTTSQSSSLSTIKSKPSSIKQPTLTVTRGNMSKSKHQVYKCPDQGCTRRFKFAAGLKRHLAAERKSQKNFRCGVCDKTSHYLKIIEKHAKQSHKSKARIFELRDDTWVDIDESHYADVKVEANDGDDKKRVDENEEINDDEDEFEPIDDDEFEEVSE